jgi:uncharacterized protein (TIGR02246 family)
MSNDLDRSAHMDRRPATRRKALIVGGGIGGPTAALAMPSGAARLPSIDYHDHSNELERITAMQEQTTENYSADEAAILDLFRNLLDDWGRADGDAYGSRFTEDADYVAFEGTHTTGRKVIAASHQQLFDKWLKGTRLVGVVESVRFLGPDVALVHATGSTIFPGEDKPRPSRDSIQTLVAVKRDGRWIFTAFHNTRIVRRGPLGWILYGIVTRFFRR